MLSCGAVQYVNETLRELGVSCTIESSADGSGLGAAVIAATAVAGASGSVGSPKL